MAPSGKHKTVSRILTRPTVHTGGKKAGLRRALKRPAAAIAGKKGAVRRVLKRPAAARVKKPAVAKRKKTETLATITERLEEVDWVPLESNPEMFTSFARQIGLPEAWSFVDVLGVDPELLTKEMVPRPCVGVTLLFEYSENMLRSQAKQEKQLKAKSNGRPRHQDVFFMKQYVGNACGTIAAIHCVANAAETVSLESDSPVGQFLERMRGQSSMARGAALADMEDFHLASDECAAGGQTEAPEASEETNHHFICFVERSGRVIELDGTKLQPIDHGPAGSDFIIAATKVIQAQFMKKDPDNIQFNMMALVKCEDAATTEPPTLPTKA